MAQENGLVCTSQHKDSVVLYLVTLRLMLAEVFDYCDGLAGQQVLLFSSKFCCEYWPL